MKNKIIVSSIVVVVILVLVSFTGVVGYQITKSSTIAKASPLFSIRSTRAIDINSKDLSCDYVGKGKDTTIPFPTSNSRNALLQSTKDIISIMDDERYNIFVKLVSRYLSGYSKYTDIDFDDLSKALKLLRNKPNEKQLSNLNDPPFTYIFCTYDNQWEPGCFIILIIESVVISVLLIIIFILKLLTGGEFTNRCFDTMIGCHDTWDCTYIACPTWNCAI